MDLDFSSDTLEKLLLKKTMTDKQWLSILSKTFDKRWFNVENVGLLLKLIINFHQKYSTVPNQKTLVALAKRYIEKNPTSNVNLNNINALLMEATNLEMNIDKDIVNQNLKGFIRKNAFLYALMDNSEILERSPDNYEAVVDKCLQNFDKVQKITFEDTDIGLNYFDEASMNNHWEFIKNPEAKIPIGWESLDKFTNGGFLKNGKMLALVMAQAGLGKSVFLSNFAVNCLKQNLKVVVISLEMSENVYATRFDAHISNTNINMLHLNSDFARERISDFYQAHPNANLYIKEYPPRSIRVSDIARYLENLKMTGHNFDVVIVDYLNLVLPERSTESMFKDGLDVSEKLRALSYKFDVPVVSAVQSNTDGMNSEKIGMENISESRGIAHTADVIFAMYQTDEDRENGIICSRVVKNRLGGCVGRISRFNLNPESLVLTDVTFNDNDILEGGNSSTNELNKITGSLQSISNELK